MIDIKLIEAEAKEYVIKTHDVCFENRIIPNYTEGQFHIDNERSYIAGRSKSLESEARKDERIRELEEALKEMLRWTDGNCAEDPLCKSLTEAENKAKHILNTKE